MSTDLAVRDQLAAEPKLTDELQKAWHLFSILLSLGRPALPRQLASLCTLFPASPDLVQDLCRIPNSPICLKDNLIVPYSFDSQTASIQLLPDFNVVNTPPQQTICYARKRKRSVCPLEFSPPLKRRSKVDLEDGMFYGNIFLPLNQCNYIWINL